MPGIATADIDTTKFDAALKEYYAATKKDAAYVVNRQALNVGIKIAMETPLADRAAITSLPQKDWWVKYVAKRLAGRGVKVKLTKAQKKNFAGRRYLQGKYTVKEARLASKQMLRSRLRRTGYIRSGWLPAVRALQMEKLKARGKVTGVTYKGPLPGRGVVARPGISPVALLINSARGAERVAGPAVQKGFDAAARDMVDFVKETFGETAKKF